MISTGSRSLLRDQVLELGHERGTLLAVLRGVLICGLLLGALYLSEQIAPILAFILQIAIYFQAGRWVVQALACGRDGRPPPVSEWPQSPVSACS